MIDKTQPRNFTYKRIKPSDGLAVTAQVWEEAHEYHRQQQRFHNLTLHGTGIISGLEVIASDPPDSTVYILPGAAIDPQGDLIVLQEPVNFDFASTTGRLHLLLSYDESKPATESEGGPLYIQAQFSIEAAEEIPEAPFVELAQIERLSESTINDAVSGEFPKPDEIDLRFRRHIHSAAPGFSRPVRIAVRETGGGSSQPGCHGAGNLARALRHAGAAVWVDDHANLDQNLGVYDLVYLVGHENFRVSREEMNTLYAFIQKGGTVFMESCSCQEPEKKAPDIAGFLDMASSFGIPVEDVKAGHPLLSEPHLFSALPTSANSEARLLAGDRLIISSCGFGCLWQGLSQAKPASREDIRQAFEWGENLVHYSIRSLGEPTSR